MSSSSLNLPDHRIFEKDIKYLDRLAHVMSAHIMRANDLTFACVMTLRQTCGYSLENEFTVVTQSEFLVGIMELTRIFYCYICTVDLLT